MADKDDRNEDAVYKVDTVPPPDGDDDAYSAPTKIGALASAVVNELIVAKERESAEVKAASKAKPRVGNGGEVDTLDDNDIEAELAFPPPPKVPTQRPPAPAAAKAEPASKISETATTPPPASVPEKAKAKAPAPAPAPAEGGMSPTMIGGAIAAAIVLLAIVYAVFLKR